MSTVIAVAGKGGTGKTTFCGMFIDWMISRGMTPILAVDADANSNLNEVLGVEAETSLGEIRELVASAELAEKNPIPAGVSKKDFMDFQFANALAEEDDFDLLVMGRTQGKGCYCFVNGLLQAEIQKIQNNYKYIVVDNEAGMEHISRGTLPSVDYMVLVSDCSRRGIQAVARIAELVDEIKLNPQKVVLVVNRAPDGVLNEGVKEEIEKHGLNLIGVIPQDEMVYEYDSEGRPTSKLPKESPARKAVENIAEKLFT
jgi:CO dehydrogenase maturation factor